MIAKIDLNLIILAFLSIIFLALNSIFCKIALENNYIDAYSFTFLRIVFAILTLIFIYLLKREIIEVTLKKNWLSGFALFLYAITFSYSYLSLDAGFGTLLLFAVVQISMIGVALIFKEKFNSYKIIGVSIAFIGLVYLLYPKDNFSVDLFYGFSMIIAGTSWAMYSILGKSSNNALSNTTDNFLKACFFVMIFMLFVDSETIYLTKTGIFYAFLSGSITSAIGYLMWYLVLPKIEINTAGILQLFVPLIAIIISVLILDEVFTLTLLISTILIVFGVLISFKKKVKV